MGWGESHTQMKKNNGGEGKGREGLVCLISGLVLSSLDSGANYLKEQLGIIEQTTNARGRGGVGGVGRWVGGIGRG